MTTYEDLTIHQKINLKGILADWARIAIERFQKSLKRHIYDSRSKRPKRRTKKLLNTWSRSVQGDENSLSGGVVLKFLMYGRFVDWGVGGKTSSHDRQVNQMLGLGRMKSSKRSAKPWLGRTRSKEVGALRRIVLKRFGMIIAESIENPLNFTVTLNQ